jgi:uncharacterized protein with HEPN domain
MLDRAILHLTIIVESIDAIRSYTAGMNRDAFLGDRLRRDAVAMNMQIIGEAGRNLSRKEQAEAPEIPWPQVVSLRHRISHDYRTINWGIVWDIIQNELDELRGAACRMLVARGETSP